MVTRKLRFDKALVVFVDMSIHITPGPVYGGRRDRKRFQTKRQLGIHACSPVVIEREITAQPENIEDRLYPVVDHRPVAGEPKRDEMLDVLCQMGKHGDTEGVSGNLFIPEAMPGREAQFVPGALAQAIESICKGGFLPLLARGKAISPTVEIAEGKQRWLLIRGFSAVSGTRRRGPCVGGGRLRRLRGLTRQPES